MAEGGVANSYAYPSLRYSLATTRRKKGRCDASVSLPGDAWPVQTFENYKWGTKCPYAGPHGRGGGGGLRGTLSPSSPSVTSVMVLSHARSRRQSL